MILEELFTKGVLSQTDGFSFEVLRCYHPLLTNKEGL